MSIRVLAEDRLDCAVLAIGWYYRDIAPPNICAVQERQEKLTMTTIRC